MSFISSLEILVHRLRSVASRAFVRQNITEVGAGGKAARLVGTGSRESHTLAVTHFPSWSHMRKISHSPQIAHQLGTLHAQTMTGSVRRLWHLDHGNENGAVEPFTFGD